MQSWVICRGCLSWPRFTWLVPDPLPHPSPPGCLGRGRRPWPCRKSGVLQPSPRLRGPLPFAPKCQGKTEERERTWCPCLGDNPKWMDGAGRVSLSWLGLEGILLEVSLHRASMPALVWARVGQAFFRPLDLWKLQPQAQPQQDCTSFLEEWERDAFLGSGCWASTPAAAAWWLESLACFALCPNAECPPRPSPAEGGLRPPLSPHTPGTRAANARGKKGPWPSSLPTRCQGNRAVGRRRDESGLGLWLEHQSRAWARSAERWRRFAGWREPFSPPPF